MIQRWRLTAAAVLLAAAVASCGPSGGGTAVGPFGSSGTPGAHCTAAQWPREVVGADAREPCACACVSTPGAASRQFVGPAMDHGTRSSVGPLPWPAVA
jgi:hypothetical protein